jgi:hypothetical protein
MGEHKYYYAREYLGHTKKEELLKYLQIWKCTLLLVCLQSLHPALFCDNDYFYGTVPTPNLQNKFAISSLADTLTKL